MPVDPTDAPASLPERLADAEGAPVTDLDHARYDRDGWMESALRAQAAVAELQARLAAAESAREAAERICDSYARENQQLSDKADAALARAERAEKALREAAEWHDSEVNRLDCLPQNDFVHWQSSVHAEQAAKARAALAPPVTAEET